ncbi:MAG TPA: glycosyltransferase family A protein [Gemmatimonadaceae bacterium]|nr:glycosyltransferase family A protein [Gemmatimonadaceae bacterium]
MARPASVTESTAPLISIVVPVHNGAEFLDRCLASIAAQSESRFEVLIIDDASEDESHSIAQEWVERDAHRFSCVRHNADRPQGIARTYLDGIARSRGSYLAFLEQDDAWSARYLERKVEVLESDVGCRVGCVFTRHRVEVDGPYGWDMALRRWWLDRRLPKGVPFDNSRNLFRSNNVVTFSALVCRRELWNTIPQPPDLETPYYDWWVLAHLSLCTLFVYDTETTVTWRCSPASRLGRQTYREHKEELGSFLRDLYASLERESARSARTAGDYAAAARVTDLLTEPSLATAARAARANPNWTLWMLASMAVNRIKKG